MQNLFSNLRSGSISYLTGIFLFPWVLVWSSLSLMSAFLLLNYPDQIVIDPSDLDFASSGISPMTYWQLVILFCLTNYSFSFFMSKKYPRINYFFLSSSIIAITFLLVKIWNYT